MPQEGGRHGGLGARGGVAEPDNQILEVMPVVVGALIAAHVLAFAYWIYRLLVERQPQRRKTN